MYNVIQKLVKSGECVFYLDMTSGTGLDFSNYGNDGVLSNTRWTNAGVGFDSNGVITIADSPELQTTEGTYIVSSKTGFMDQTAGQKIIGKMNAGGVQVELCIDTATTLDVHTGSDSSLTTNIVGKKYIGVNWNDGEKPEGFIDGASQGLFTAITAISVDSATFYLGNIFSLNSANKNNISTFMYVNRKLTATEHSQLYGELSQ